MRTLLIDDLRNIEADRVARTFDEGVQALQNEGPWDILLLDHDYGDPDPDKNGEGIMKFIEANPTLKPRCIRLVTANPVGRQRMAVIIRKLYPEGFDI
jgi:hypothetical protein